MATYQVTTSQNYSTINGGVFNDYDRIVISQGARLTINTDTNIIEQIVCNTLGDLLVESINTVMPIFVKTGADSGNGLLRFEAGGKMEISGDWIEIGTSDGTANQEFTLPTNILLENIPNLPTTFIFESGSTDPEVYNRVSSFTDTFGDSKLGVVFTHDVANNKIVFGDGTNGYIPPNGAVIKIPNIIFVDESVSGYTDFDTSSSGTLNFDKVLFTDNYAHNYANATSVTLRNFGYGTAREIFNMSAVASPILENGGVLLDTVGYLNIAASSNFDFDNIFIYTTLTGNNLHGFSATNADRGTFNKCKVIAPNIQSASSRSCFNTTSSNIVFINCNAATHGVGYNFGGGASGARLTDCGYNGAGKRNPTGLGGYMVSAVNCTNIIANRVSSYPLLASDGAIAGNVYGFNLTTGSSNITLNDCDLYCGDSTTPSRINNPIRINGSGHRINKIRIHGVFSSDTINMNTGSSNTQAYNVTLNDPQDHVSDMNWSTGDIMDLVASADKIDVSPATSGRNTGTFHFYQSNDKTAGAIWKPMGNHDVGSERFSEISVSGEVLFNNGGSMYMNTSGDVVEFYSNIHKGITDFTGTFISGSNTGNFQVEIAVRNPGGTYGAFFPLSNSGAVNAFDSLSGYDLNVGLQVKYRITRLTSNLTNYISYIGIYTSVDPNYEIPFILEPSTLTLTGLQPNTEIRLYDSANPTSEISGQENVNNGTFEYDYDGGVYPEMNIQIHSLGFQNIYLKNVNTSSSASIPIQQIVDRQYSNN